MDDEDDMDTDEEVDALVWSAGEIDIKDRKGNSRLINRRFFYFNCINPDEECSYRKTIAGDDPFLARFQMGDSVEFRFTGGANGWQQMIRKARMTVSYEPDCDKKR